MTNTTSIDRVTTATTEDPYCPSVHDLWGEVLHRTGIQFEVYGQNWDVAVAEGMSFLVETLAMASEGMFEPEELVAMIARARRGEPAFGSGRLQ